jgi:tripartite-type tricarboxylate transporter receptor subunit TctC
MKPFFRALGLLGAFGAGAAGLMAGAPAAAAADSAATFYRGQTIRLVVGYEAGAGYDVYARVFGRFFVRHLAGAPTLIVQNMPGAGSLNMANYLANTAPRDGATLGAASRSVWFEPLWGDTRARFDPRTLTWIGSINQDVSTCVMWHTSPVKTLADAERQGAVVGSAGAVSDSTIFPRILNGILGTKFRIVSGYKGTETVGLAMERGEVEGTCGATWATIKGARKDWIAGHKISIIVQLALAKHPELPNVALVTEAAKSESARQALELVFAPQAMGRPITAPPDVPADRVHALRAAFDATMKDPAFLAQAAKQKLEVMPLDGASVAALLVRVFASPPEVIAKVKALRGG